MQPGFGTNLRRFLFDQSTDRLEDAVKNELLKTIKYWLPYVNVENIETRRTVEDINNYTIAVSITFSVSGDLREFKTVTFGFNSNGGVSVRG